VCVCETVSITHTDFFLQSLITVVAYLPNVLYTVAYYITLKVQCVIFLSIYWQKCNIRFITMCSVVY